MTTATAQAEANIAFIKLVQRNTIFGNGKAGNRTQLPLRADES